MDCIIEDKSRLLGEGGQYLTQGLFYEYRHQAAKLGPYCLKEYDWKGCKSMYQVYMSCASEYEAALKILGSWKHWQILCQAPFFAREVEKWREEVEIREAALGKATLIAQAKEGNVSAAKELVKSAEKRSVGRPSKAEIDAERKKQAAIDTKVIDLLKHVK